MFTASNRVCYSVALLFALLFSVSHAQVTTFSYQGRLVENGVAADGSYNLEFTLFDADTGGAQIGSPITLNGQTVINGLFTVLLDFGAEFNGQSRWLQIKVNGATLAPRQRITAAPHAQYADIAGALRLPFEGAGEADHLSGVLKITDNSTNGFTFGIVGETTNGLGAGVYGAATNFGGSGTGVLGNAYGSNGVGVFGTLVNPTGTGAGVRAESYSGAGVALFAKNYAAGPAMIVEASTGPGLLLYGSADVFGVTNFYEHVFFRGVGAPFTVISNTKVNNLNADLLDGLDSSAFLNLNTPLGGALTGTVGNAALADSSVTTPKIALNAVTDDRIASVNWLKLTGVPAGLADGDNDTTYTAGNGLVLNGTQFRLRPGTAAGQVLKWDGANWELGLDELGLPFAVGNGLMQIGDQIQFESGTAPGQIWKWNGTEWVLAPDEGGITYSAGNGLALNGSTFSLIPGTANGQVLKWNGTQWALGTDQGAFYFGSGPISVQGSTIGLVPGNQVGQTLVWDGFNWTLSQAPVSTGQELIGNGTTISPLRFAQQGATPGQVLKWNGTRFAPAPDNDLSGQAAGGDLTGSYPNPSLATNPALLNKVSGGAMTSLGGNIGIGVANPASALHVNGSALVSGGLQVGGLRVGASATAGQVLTADANGNATWQPLPNVVGSQWSQNGTRLFYNGGNVGVGTNNPTGMVQVAGAVLSGPSTLDQQWEASQFMASGTAIIWQSFTAGASGYLTRWDQLVGSEFWAAPLPGMLSVYAGEGNGGALLARQPIEIGNSLSFKQFVLERPVAVVAGQKYTVELNVPGQSGNWIGFHVNMNVFGYTGGKSSSPNDQADLVFRTYVAPGAPGAVFTAMDGAKVGIGTDRPEINLAVRDTDTGFNSPGDGQLDLFANNAVTMSVRGANVGIGTTNPTALLDVNGTARMTGFRLGSSAPAGHVLTTDASGVGTWQPLPAGLEPYTGANGINVTGSTIGIAPNGVTNSRLASDFASLARVSGGAMVATADGRIGINVASPLFRLDVGGGARINTAVAGLGDVVAGQDGFYSYRDSGRYVHMSSNGTFNDLKSVGAPLSINHDSNQATLINANGGNVGIGTSSPTARLHVNGTVRMNGIQLGAGATTGHVLTASSDGTGSWQPLPAANVYTAGNGLFLSGNQFNIATLGVTNSMLAVDAVTTVNLALNAVSADKIASNAVTPAKLALDGGSLNRVSGGNMWINGSNVGVGTGSPAAKLHVAGGDLRLDDGREIRFTDNGQISSYDNMHRILFRRSENKMELREFGDLIFSPGSTTGLETARVVMKADGNVGIGTATPAARLDVAGVTRTSGFTMPTGAAAGHVLTTDANGVGTWQALPPSGGIYTAGSGLALANNAFSIAPLGVQTGMIAANAIDDTKLAADVDSLPKLSGNTLLAQNGVMQVNGWVGIQAGSPFGPLHVRGDTGTALFVGQDRRVGVRTTSPTADLDVLGSFRATTKNFIIDHPLDPENKYLVHGVIESDEYKNLYDGVVRTDAQGYAVVTLPDWFSALNTDFRYQLTIVDEADSEEFVLAKVVQKIQDNRFVIRTSHPNVEVNWQVTGRRHDAFVRENPLVVEQEKPAELRGRYRHPEVHGQPEERGQEKPLPARPLSTSETRR